MQEAGMRTAQLDQIMRQKDPELLKAVQHLANGEVKAGIKMLADQDRVTEIPNPKDRISVSRAEEDARIYTNNAASLGDRLATDITKTTAVDFRQRSKQEAAEKSEPIQERPAVTQPERRSYEYAASEHRLAAVAQDYASRPERAVVIAPDRSERRELTRWTAHDA